MTCDEDPVLVLRPRQRSGLVLLSAASGGCVAIGFFMSMWPGGNLLGWLALAFTGVAGLCLASVYLPGNSALVLSVEGFAVRFASRVVFYPWNEVDYFAVANSRVVAFRLFDTSQRVSPAVRQITGYDGALPASYGSLDPELLAARLNECRQRFASPT